MGFYLSLIFILLALTSQVFGCALDEPNAPKWNPMGKPFYLLSGFGDIQNGHINLGIDLSTQGQPGQPVQAPENGKVLQWRADSEETSLIFQGESGNRWLFSGLSKITAKSMQKPATLFAEYDTIAYSGETLHLELHTSDGKQAVNPCEIGVACHDTIAPTVVGIATWDAGNPRSGVRFTSKEAFQNGCVEIAPNTRNIQMAIQVKDYSNSTLRSTMGLHSIAFRQGSNPLYVWESLALPMNTVAFPKEILWSENASQNGTWYPLLTDMDKTNMLFQNLLRESPKHASLHPLTLEIADHRLNGTLYHFSPREKCSPVAKIDVTPNSVLYTDLGQPWLNLGQCKSGAKISLLDSNKMILIRSLCDSLPHSPTTLQGILAQWPSAQSLNVRIGEKESASIGFMSLTGKGATKMQDHVFFRVSPSLPQGSNTFAWIWNKNQLEIHPKGLSLLKPLDICVPAKREDQIEAKSPENNKWNGLPSKFFYQPDSTASLCVSLKQIQDIRVGKTP